MPAQNRHNAPTMLAISFTHVNTSRQLMRQAPLQFIVLNVLNTLFILPAIVTLHACFSD